MFLLTNTLSGLNLARCGVNVCYNRLRTGNIGEAHAQAIHDREWAKTPLERTSICKLLPFNLADIESLPLSLWWYL